MGDNNDYKKNASSTEDFIDEQVTNIRVATLKREIMEELNTFIQSTVSKELEYQKITSNDSFELNHPGCFEQNGFLSHMKQEIEFLRKQIQYRDELINSLLSENSYKKITHNIQKDAHSDIFLHPKKTVKPSIQNEQKITCSNRFNALLKEEKDDNNNNKENELMTLQQSNNITERKKNKSNTGQKNDHKKITPKKLENISKRKNHKSNTVHKNDDRKVVAIMGDSMLKNVHGYKLSSQEQKVVVKSFSGAKTECMNHYIVPTLKLKPDVVVLHCGTNDLKSKQPEEISENIIDLAKSVSQISESTGVIISGIVPRGDDLNQNAEKVNEMLEKLCNDLNVGFVDNSRIDPRKHLNNSRLHLNRSGSTELARNLQNIIEC